MSIRIDKVYTRSGDKGETGLVGGHRVPKDNTRIEAYGTVDELNSVIGLLREALRHCGDEALSNELEEELRRIQQQLFNLGSELACPPGKLLDGMPKASEESITRLETVMDRWSETLSPLASFVLPGGGALSSWAHLARTVCRRAERVVITLRREENEVRPETAQYLNRLGDYFFVLSRYAARKLGQPEILWDPKIK